MRDIWIVCLGVSYFGFIIQFHDCVSVCSSPNFGSFQILFLWLLFSSTISFFSFWNINNVSVRSFCFADLWGSVKFFSLLFQLSKYYWCVFKFIASILYHLWFTIELISGFCIFQFIISIWFFFYNFYFFVAIFYFLICFMRIFKWLLKCF